MDHTAVEKLIHTGEEMHALRFKSLNDDTRDLIALHKDYTIHDLERFRLSRRRFRGKFATSALDDFVAYVKDNANATEGSDKPAGFVAADEPTALVFFNLHSEEPGAGHADWTARLELEKTAAYRALLAIEGKPLTQRTLADFCEDWQDRVVAYGENDALIRLNLAVAAINKLDIKSSKQSGHVDGHFKAAKSSLEQVEAQLSDATPHTIGFSCEPYRGLKTRDFRLRVSILTSHDDPRLVLRIVQKEAMEEDMILEFKQLLAEKIGDTAQLTIGSFAP